MELPCKSCLTLALCKTKYTSQMNPKIVMYYQMKEDCPYVKEWNANRDKKFSQLFETFSVDKYIND